MTPTARPPVPKPGPPPARERWFQPRRSGFDWEQEGLDHVRQLMPHAEPYRAWATFQFTGSSGRVNECDLLIAVPGGVYLLELKGHPGRLVNHGDTWQFHAERVRTLKNPLHLTDLKAKELKDQLTRAARALGEDPRRIPFIKPAVFLHSPDLRSELDEFQQASVYGRGSGLPGIWDGLLSLPPERESWRVTPQTGQLLEKLMKRIGVSHSTAHLRFGDDWRLEPRALDAGPGWEDRLAVRDDGLVQESGRVRIYLAGQAPSPQQRQAVDRAARREYQVLQGINHRGIVQAVQIREHVGGPAILFRHRASDLRLDAYLDAYGGRLTPEVRLDLVRQLAEAVRYAHNRSLYHRALSARSVYVSAREDGSDPVLRIADWQTAARDFETTLHRTLGDTPLDGGLIADVAQVYLAPETDQEFADPVDLDVFGLGSLAYLLLTGRPPADRRSALVDRLAAEGGLHPYAIADGISAALDGLVFQATAADVRDRPASADEFLRLLDAAEADAAAPEPPGAAAVDPLTVQPGQALDGLWTVTRILGTGATARALLVRRTADDPDDAGSDSPRVFKVALDHEKDARLYAEAEALKEVGGGHIVKLLAEPRELGGRTVLEIEYAGGFRSAADRDPVSLGSRLRGEGALGYDQLERFGNDLFAALDSLAARGVRHRDIKPDNLGLFKRSDGSWQLMLFDFSLADVPDQDLHAGTRGYLDPLLGGSRRERYDDHAERYAAAVTLHEMASGERPVWGDGQTNPLAVPAAKLYVAGELFDQTLSGGLTEFFERALHRDVDQRYDSLRDMQEAWRRVFRKADSSPPATTPATVGMTAEDIEDAREQAAAAAGLKTPLDAAGLSPRAVSVAAALGASTVEALLDIPPHTISRARGAGNVIRKELNRRHRQWTHALRKRPASRGPVVVPADAPPEALEPVETLAARLTPPEGKRRTKPRPDVVRTTLQLPGCEPLESWPAQPAIAKALGISQPTVSQHQQAAVEQWAALQWLRAVRDELVVILSEQGRVLTAEELAGELRARHGAGDGDPADTLAQALAVVRAAADTEARKRDEHEDTGPDAEPPARLAVLRRGGRVLLALEDQPGADEPTPAELADYAAELGVTAARVAHRDPLPGRATVLRELRVVDAPEGMASLADTRLVELAAAMAGGVGLSPRLELFPLDLDLARALRVSQAAAGVRPDRGIGTDDLLARVRSRFPGLAVLADTTYVELEEALGEADFPLAYDTQRRRFMPRTRETTDTRIEPSVSILTSTGSLIAAAQSDFALGRDPRRILAARLETARRRGGFVALTLKGTQLPEVAERLAERFDVVPVTLDELFLTTLRELAVEQGVSWQALLKADARFAATSTIGAGLNSYTRLAFERLAARLVAPAERSGPRTVLLLHQTGLVARYWAAGGRELLVTLQESARRPADRPHGLWLLVPMEDPEASPALDGRTVDIVDRVSEWVVLEGLFLKELKGQEDDGDDVPGSSARQLKALG
ncbi:BREX system serine/threonine kinase PglW [Streptomyces sp. FL07-04A]|uniref:BREX system serine/threonine kinase PglW n=1 Tax=Streptomyces sp. FL07-04A TaxID=3028658 RepID=UPI0029A55B5C|nr:BREX system serine/threonine kinase PglW [Streptomyces sp. FL07-04A]MDX3579767.1 BREX system serine/threonine kinase PglW [Streptomyces sp. FL07-04A]